jgi:hypothetical protein
MLHSVEGVMNRKVAKAIAGRTNPRRMVPVRRTGAEVTTTFWAKLARDRRA